MSKSTLSVSGIYIKNSIDFVESVFACYQQGKTVVLLNHDNKADITKQFSLEQEIDPELTNGWAKLEFQNRDDDNIAQIAFTSGTEGIPKGIALTHKNMADTVHRLNQVMHIDATIREYIGIPVYHSFGFGRCRIISSLGGEFYIPPQGFNPLEIQEMMAKKQINAISAVPSLWRSLLEHTELFGQETKCIKWIEIGSQYMSADEKIKLKSLFPSAIIVQHYGLTEASRATFLEIHKHGKETILESVGQAVGDTKIELNSHNEIIIRGSCVAKNKIVNGKLEPLTDDDGWLTTSDTGEIKGELLYFKGRSDDIINCGGVKVLPDLIEKKIRERLNIDNGIACVKIPDHLRGDGILIAHQKALNIDENNLTTLTKEILLESNINLGNSLKLMALDTIPTTATGKIQRKKISLLYNDNITSRTGQTNQAEYDNTKPDSREHELAELWKKLLNLEHLNLDENFYTLGGDSLTAISAVIKMKAMGIPEHVCKGILQGYSINDIVKLERQGNTDTLQDIDLSNNNNSTIKNSLNMKIIRGLLVLFVIFAHWSDGIIDRLPSIFQLIKPALAPLLSFGTPGFAIMYGAAMGYTAYPLFCKTPKRFRDRILPIFGVLLTGILLLGGLRILYLSTEQTLNITNVASSFYDVLTYYLLATATIYLWFIFLKKSGFPVLTAFVSAGIFHIIYINYMAPLSSLKTEGFAELGKLFLVGKYNYFNMTCGAFIGLGFGILLTQKDDIVYGCKELLVPIALLVVLAVLYSVTADQSDQWFVWPVSRVQGWRWIFYTGACLALFLAIGKWVVVYESKHTSLRVLTEVIASFGFLAFPFFILHASVIPIKELLVFIGLREGVALLIAVGGFVAISTIIIQKARRLQFAK